jgi:hypothetical protein
VAPQHQKDLYIKKEGLVVDIVSIGSESRRSYFDAQQDTWARHPAVRHFFRITERQDKDPLCEQHLNMSVMRRQVDACVQKFRTPRLSKYRMLPFKWIKNKPNPLGWYCATTRPGSGMGVAESYYHENNESLPDYLMLVDDDTYYNIDSVLKEVTRMTTSSLTSTIWAGCLHLMERFQRVRFTPHGGSGTVFSRGVLQRLFRPLDCTSGQLITSNGSFISTACNAIKFGQLGEKQLFHQGMSLNQLLVAKYNDLPSCFFADVLMGFFVEHFGLADQFFNISLSENVMVQSPFIPLFGSISIMAKGKKQKNSLMKLGKFECHTDEEGCQDGKPICHHMTPEMMRNVTAQARQRKLHIV